MKALEPLQEDAAKQLAEYPDRKEKTGPGADPLSGSVEPAAGDQCMNANVHLRVPVEVRLSGEELKVYYPKVLGGLKTLWSEGRVK
jgi:hypothetical protein